MCLRPTVRRAAMLAIALLVVAAPLAAQAPSTKPTPAKRPAMRRFAAKDIVEVKCDAAWKRATVRNVRGEWLLVVYDEASSMEWVEPWRARTVGSDYEIGPATPNPSVTTNRKGEPEPPPRERPGPAPFASGGGASESVGAAPISWDVTSVEPSTAPERKVAADVIWTYVAGAPASRLNDKSIPLVGGVQTDGSDTVTALDLNGPIAFVGYQSRGSVKQPIAEVVAAATGASVARAALDGATRPLGAAALEVAEKTGLVKSARVFGRAEGSAIGTRQRVDVWDLDGRDVKHVVSFEPYKDESSKDVDRVIALDAGRLLTTNGDGHLIAWQVAAGTAKSLWHVKLGRGEVALSPDRQTLAASRARSLAFVNVADGNVVGAIATDAPWLTSLSYRGDGRRLAALGASTVYAFDLDAGKQLASFGQPVASAVRHLAGDAVLVVQPLKSIVIDVARNAALARLTIGDAERTAVVGDRLVAVQKVGARRTLSSWTMAFKPQAAVALPTVPEGPDTRAAIDVQAEADEFARGAIIGALRAQVAAHGWTLAEEGGTASVRLVARSQDDGPARVTRLTVEVNGRPAWTTSTQDASNFAADRPSEPSADAQRRTDIPFLKSVVLPRTIFAPMDALPAGVPSLTLSPNAIKSN